MAAQRATWVPVVHWAARLSALALLVMVIAFYIGVGPPTFFKGPPDEIMRQTAFLLTTLGLAVGWMWDSVGALLVLGGMIVFSALEYSAHRTLPGRAFPYFWIPGVLWLISAVFADRTR